MTPQEYQVVMVIGGAGFLGQHVVKHLQERGRAIKEVRVFDVRPYRNKLKHAENVTQTSIVGDIREFHDISEAMEGVDAVIHAASLIDISMFPDVERLEATNVLGTKNVIEACVQRGVKSLIYTGTRDVMVGDWDLDNIDETVPTPAIQNHAYPRTKLKAEQAVLGANGRALQTGDADKLRTLSLRVSSLYGEDDIANKRRLESGFTMFRVGSRNAKLHMNYVGNSAWAHVVANQRLARDPSVGGHFYYVTDDTPAMNRVDFYELLLADFGIRASKFTIPLRAAFLLFMFIKAVLYIIKPVYRGNFPLSEYFMCYLNHQFTWNRGQAERRLGYQPIYPFEECAKRARKYYGEGKL